MSFYKPFLNWLNQQPELAKWADILPDQLKSQLAVERWGDLPQWQAAIDNLPALTPSSIELKHQVSIGSQSDIAASDAAQIKQHLMALHPWRKGPFHLFGLHVDTEWRSDWKWDRVIPHISPLKDKRVLDVGCGNGYHCLRMLGEGAQRVIGIDPSVKFVYQFYAIKHFLDKQLPVDVLPLGIEHMPQNLQAFDTVFSMGILYHRRSPMDHLRELKQLLCSGGQLVLETLVVDGPEGYVLVPEGRYGKMPNVWFLPSPATLISWLKKNGFQNPQLVDTSRTSIDEQRSTEWMHFDSLQSFLDPTDPSKTIEGHPGPVRAVFTAQVG